MKIKNLKLGDIIFISDNERERDGLFFDNQWVVVKVYRKIVLARSVKVPQIRRCFSYGELVVLGFEKHRCTVDKGGLE